MNVTELLSLTLKEAQYHQALLIEAILAHLKISGLALFMAILAGFPLGFVSSRWLLLSRLFTSVFSTARVIPGLALLAFLMPLLGTGFIPTVTALAMLALPSIMLNTMAGFRQIEAQTIETAHGLGLNPWQILQRIELPLAAPYILTGIRIACVEIIAATTLAAFIGGGGLGTLIINGLSTYNFPLLFIGALPVACLALMAELLFNQILKAVNRYQTC